MTEATDPTAAADEPAVSPAPADIPGAETLTSDPAASSTSDTAPTTFGGVPAASSSESDTGPTRDELEAQVAELQAQLAAANTQAATLAPAGNTAPAAPDPSQPAPPVPADPGPTSSSPIASPVPSAPASPSPESDPAPAAPPADWSGKVGSVVTHRYFDPYRGAGGEEVEVTGIVAGLEGDRARVSWLLDVSDPLPVDELTVVE